MDESQCWNCFPRSRKNDGFDLLSKWVEANVGIVFVVLENDEF